MLDESLYESELGVAFEKGTHEELAEELTRTLQEMKKMEPQGRYWKNTA